MDGEACDTNVFPHTQNTVIRITASRFLLPWIVTFLLFLMKPGASFDYFFNCFYNFNFFNADLQSVFCNCLHAQLYNTFAIMV